MHKAGANERSASDGGERHPLFEVPRRPAGQKMLLGLQMPVWETVKGSFMKAWACLAEFFCMTCFIYAGTGTVVFGCHSSDTSTGATASTGQVVTPQDCFLSESRVLTIAAAFGFSIFVLVYVSASFSGGHLNPAITLSFLLTKKITLMRALAYWCCQLGGAILGSSFVYATDRTGWYAAKGGTNRLLPGISQASGWLLESILTMTLVFTVFAATDSNRAKISTHLPVFAPMAIGMAVFISHLAAVALDGCSVNPARSFGPAVVSGVWTDQWIFWVGPFTGAIVAAILYELFFRPSGPIRHPVDEHSTHSSEDGDLEAGDKHMARSNGRDGSVIRLPPYSGIRGAHDEETVRPVKVVIVPEHTPINGGSTLTDDASATRASTARQYGAVNAVPTVASDGVPGSTGSRV